MRTYDAAVVRRRASSGERCLANGDDLKRIGRAVGDQVRMARSPDRVALYTVEPPATEEPGRVGMGWAGRTRLAAPDEFKVTVHVDVVDQLRADDQAAADGEFVERLIVGRRRQLAIIAPHGGEIEEHTDVQACVVRDRLASVAPWLWMCKGWGVPGQGAFARWHITSTDISPTSFPLLKRMISRPFTHAISFHGFDHTEVGGADVRIGGLADDAFKASVSEAIEEQVRRKDKPWGVVVDREGRFSGLDPENIVNRLAPEAGGLQIEQSLRARAFMAGEIAEAVASAYQ